MTTKITVTLSPVKHSSQIDSIGHDAASNTLAVKFKQGGVYHYHGVSAEQFAEIQKAKSLGSHLHQHIKPKHKFTKLP